MPVRATIDLAALRHNARVLQDRVGDASLMAVVKANAYGHGASVVTQTLFEEGVRHFAVARPAEGIRLREAGVKGRILVLGAPLTDHLPLCEAHDLSVTVPSAAVAEAVCKEGTSSQPVRAHVTVDTGMGRIGLAPGEAPTVVSRLKRASGVVLAGVWTHFATADEPGSAFAQAQLDEFEALLDRLDTADVPVHVANTGALLTLGPPVHAFSPSLVRTGISLYGLAARRRFATELGLRPVMHLQARVTHLKTVSSGTPISYGANWRASEPTRIATLGVGYGDGYPRRASGRARVRMGGHERPVVGDICMDMCMVDLGPPGEPPATDVAVGDEALLFGPEGPTAYDVAEWADTIPYEICSGLSPRVPRRYVGASTTPASPFPTRSISMTRP